jgi:hypothetical protein
MSITHYEGRTILQVTRGQCVQCRARDVFSVLVAESSADGEVYRTFYTCEHSLIPWHYSAHECRNELDNSAPWRRWQSSSLLQWLRPRSAPLRAVEPTPLSTAGVENTAAPHGIVTPAQH